MCSSSTVVVWKDWGGGDIREFDHYLSKGKRAVHSKLCTQTFNSTNKYVRIMIDASVIFARSNLFL